MIGVDATRAVDAAFVLLRHAARTSTGDPVGLGGVSAPRLVRFLTAQGIANYVAKALRSPAIESRLDPELVRFLCHLRGRNACRNGRLVRQLENVGQLLGDIGIEVVALKGAAELLRPAYDSPADRLMTDLDLLVPDRRIDDAIERLKRSGFTDGGASYDRRRRHAPPLWHPDEETAIELHTAVSSASPSAIIDAGSFFDASIPVGRAGLRVPAPADRICHLVAHGQLDTGRYKAGWLLLRDVADLAAMRSRFGPEALDVARDRFRDAGLAGPFDSFLAASELVFRLPETSRLIVAADRRWAGRAVGRLSRPWLLKMDLLSRSIARTLARLSASPAARQRLFSGLADPAQLRGFLLRQRNKFRGV